MTLNRHLVSLTFGLCVAAAGHVFAQSLITNPDWRFRPTETDLRQVYPTRADGRSGAVKVKCIVTIHGTMRACEVVEETPGGLEFGAAALSLMPKFLMSPKLRDGAPVEGDVVIPIVFSGYNNANRVGTQGSRADRQVESAGVRLITNAAWAAAPSAADVAAAFPSTARDAKTGGLVVLRCRYTPDGGLNECRIIKEAPDDLGLAKAALGLTDKFKAPPDMMDLAKERPLVDIPITFSPALVTAKGPVTGAPSIIAGPTIEQLNAALPKDKNLPNGQGIIRCQVGAEGKPQACSVLRETPLGSGYGAVALSLADNFRFSAWSNEGMPIIGGTFNIPVSFRDLPSQQASTPP